MRDPLTPKRPGSRGWPRRACRTRRSPPSCSCPRVPSNTTWPRSSPSSTSPPAASSCERRPGNLTRDSYGGDPRGLTRTVVPSAQETPGGSMTSHVRRHQAARPSRQPTGVRGRHPVPRGLPGRCDSDSRRPSQFGRPVVLGHSPGRRVPSVPRSKRADSKGRSTRQGAASRDGGRSPPTAAAPLSSSSKRAAGTRRRLCPRDDNARCGPRPTQTGSVDRLARAGKNLVLQTR